MSSSHRPPTPRRAFRSARLQKGWWSMRPWSAKMSTLRASFVSSLGWLLSGLLFVLVVAAACRSRFVGDELARQAAYGLCTSVDERVYDDALWEADWLVRCTTPTLAFDMCEQAAWEDEQPLDDILQKLRQAAARRSATQPATSLVETPAPIVVENLAR